MKLVKNKRIQELNLVITHQCNLKCVYCYELNKDSGVMPINVAKEVITKYLNKELDSILAINLFGGEPFTRFQFIRELCEWTWELDWPREYVFCADTNGVNLSEEVKDWTRSNRHRFKMLLSLDGTPETHNRNRSNSFDKIDLDFFIKYWPEEGVKMTISDLSLSSLADDIIFLHSKGLRIKGSNFAEGININNFNDSYVIIKEQLTILVDWYVEHPEVNVAQLFDLELSLCESHKHKRIKYCGCGTNATKVVDIDGSEYPCTYFFPMAMPKAELEKIKKINLHDESLFINEDCLQNCYIYPICKGCYGDNYTSTGSLNKRSEQKCRLAKLRALAVATLQAKRILSKNPTEITQQEHDTIVAIKNIVSIFGEIGEADSQ